MLSPHAAALAVTLGNNQSTPPGDLASLCEHYLPRPWAPDDEHRLLKDAAEQVELSTLPQPPGSSSPMAGTYHVQIRSIPAGRAATDAVPLSQVVLQHHRTDGIRIDAQPLSGGHLLHLAVAGCVFNDLYHLAAARGIRLTDVRVAATEGFEGEQPTVSTGVTYQVAVAGEASQEQLRALVSEVDRIASIPDVLRRETTVSLSDVKIDATRQAPAAGEPHHR